MASRASRIEQILSKNFTPTHLEVFNETHKHSVPDNAQTHYKVIMVSDAFSNTARIKRHRMVHERLQDEFAQGMHALSLHLFAPNEWNSKKPVDSPNCKGGSHHDR